MAPLHNEDLQVHDIVDNKDGATEAILNQVDRNPDQIHLICEDIKIAFHRRAIGFFWNWIHEYII